MKSKSALRNREKKRRRKLRKVKWRGRLQAARVTRIG